MTKTIIFKVTYLGQGGRGYDKLIMRTIELEENQTLHDLHEVIIYQAFKWNDPHLYKFLMDNKPPFSKERDKSMEYTLEDPDEPVNLDINSPNSSYTKLNNLFLKNNQKFLFVFDYGDEHHFEIRVADFGKAEDGREYPMILSVTGIAPGQYVIINQNEIGPLF